MKVFLDTANVELVRKLFPTGLVDGITTNPTLIRKSGADPYDVYSELEQLGVKDISMEVTGEVTQMYDDAQHLISRFGDIATIKLPMTSD